MPGSLAERAERPSLSMSADSPRGDGRAIGRLRSHEPGRAEATQLVLHHEVVRTRLEGGHGDLSLIAPETMMNGIVGMRARVARSGPSR